MIKQQTSLMKIIYMQDHDLYNLKKQTEEEPKRGNRGQEGQVEGARVVSQLTWSPRDMGACMDEMIGWDCFIGAQQIYLMPDKRKSFSRGCSRYDDWVCLFCHNHNYSFRTICNRCHLTTKDYNAYLLAQQQLAFQASLPETPLFPYFVLLMVDNEPWGDEPIPREPTEPPAIAWLDTLINE